MFVIHINYKDFNVILIMKIQYFYLLHITQNVHHYSKIIKLHIVLLK